MSPYISSSLPKPSADHTIRFLFSFAPSGVYPATIVTNRAVRSYRTISPLPITRRYLFCGTSRQRVALPRYYLAPYPMEPGLSSIAFNATATVWLIKGIIMGFVVNCEHCDRTFSITRKINLFHPCGLPQVLMFGQGSRNQAAGMTVSYYSSPPWPLRLPGI